MRILALVLLALSACGPAVSDPDPEPAELGGAYDGVCREDNALPPCQCYDGFLSAFVTRVACDQAGLNLCANVLDQGECISL